MEIEFRHLYPKLETNIGFCASVFVTKKKEKRKRSNGASFRFSALWSLESKRKRLETVVR